MKNKLKKLFVISLLLTFSQSAHADVFTIISILVKIYNDSVALNIAQNRVNHDYPKVPPVQNMVPESTEPAVTVTETQENNNPSITREEDITKHRQTRKHSVQLSAELLAKLEAKYDCQGQHDCKMAAMGNTDLERFKNRHLTSSEFKAQYISLMGAFADRSLTLKTATEKDILEFEKRLEFLEEQAQWNYGYKIALKKEVYKIVELIPLPFEELFRLRDIEAYENPDFNLHPVSSTLIFKAQFSGALEYERTHDTGTNCMFELGGQGGIRPNQGDCDKLYAIVMQDAKKHHKIATRKLTTKDYKQIMYELDPHVSWD